MAREPTRSTRRRASWRGWALALIVTFALGTLLGWGIFGRHGSDPQPTVASTTATVPKGISGAKVALARPSSYPKLGLTLGLPAGWEVAQQSGVIKLSTRDGTVSLAVSNSGAPGRAKEVRRSDQGQLLALFKPAHVLGRQRGKIGGVPALSTEIAGTTKRHRPLRILTTAASTRYRTYSVQVFSTPRPPTARLAEVRAILESFRFAKPA